MSGRSGPNRKSVPSQNSQFAKSGPGLWASRVNFALTEFLEVRHPQANAQTKRKLVHVGNAPST
jgi:hypothetical protein